MPPAQPRYAIGIDFGTTNSCVAVMMNGKVDIITSDTSSKVTPSVVTFTESGAKEVGEPELYNDPKNIVFAIKRLIGRKFNDSSVQRDMKMWPFKVVEGQNNEPLIQIDQKGVKLYSPQEVATIIFASIKASATNYIGHEAKESVITVPAYFNEAQRQATRKAAESAGLKVLRIINEPTAAAISYWLQRDIQDGNILVYDLGGGTFDVSIVQVNQGCISVKATNGDTHLGGHDFDHILMDHCLGVIKSQHKVDLENDSEALSKLNRACESAKRRLIGREQVKIVAEALINGRNFQLDIARAAFDEMCEPLFKRTIDLVKSSLKDAQMTTKDIDQVVLVGGSTRILKISSLLSELFGGIRPKMNIDADSAVAYGAAVLAEKELRNTGAQLQTLNILQLNDVTPLSLGLEVAGQNMIKVVKRNTKLPHRATVPFTSPSTRPKRLRFAVYQGEHRSIHDNNHLGTIHVRPSNNIKVTFDVNESGQLSVVVADIDRGERHIMDVSRKQLDDPSQFASAVRFEKLASEKMDAGEIRKRIQNILQSGQHKESAIVSFNVGDDYVDGYVQVGSKAYELKNSDGTQIPSRISFVEGGEIFVPKTLTAQPGSSALTISPTELCYHQIFVDYPKTTERAIAIFLNHVHEVARKISKDNAITHMYCPVPSSWGYINRALYIHTYELVICRNITTIPFSTASVLGTHNKTMPELGYYVALVMGVSASSLAVYEIVSGAPRIILARDVPVGWLNIHQLLLTAISGTVKDGKELNLNYHALHEALRKFRQDDVKQILLQSDDGKLNFTLTREFFEREGVAPIVSEVLECLDEVPPFKQDKVTLFVETAGTLKARFWKSTMTGYLKGKTVQVEQIAPNAISLGSLLYARAIAGPAPRLPTIPVIRSYFDIHYQIFGEERMPIISKMDELPVKKEIKQTMKTMFRRMDVFVDNKFLNTLLLERPSHGKEMTIIFSMCRNGLLTVEYAGKAQKFDADYLAHANDRLNTPKIA